MKTLSFFCCVLVIVLVLGCAHAPVNAPLVQYTPKAGYRFANADTNGNSDELFVIVALSGGGTRAAAFSCGALEGLRDATISWKGKDTSLLAETDIISSVSGGSFAAAYYGLHRQAFFAEFPERFLYRNVTLALAGRVLNPLNWPRLASAYFDRIDLASEFYDRSVFDHHTFQDLQAPESRPFVVLNATDMARVSRFEFTQEQFDVIGSDLSAYPVARAVAASSAFPILLSPLTLNNYAPAPGYKPPRWLDDALSDRMDAPREYSYARTVEAYLQSTNTPYLHLMDGGLSDNIGLRGPAYAMTSVQNLWSLKQLLNTRIKHLVVVTVNSKPASPNNWSRKESAPGIPAVFSVVSTGPMGNYSDETVQYIKDTLETWRQEVVDSRRIAQLEGRPQEALREVKFYNISVSFDDVQDVTEREYLSNLPTSFNLPRKAVDQLREAAARIIHDSPELDRLRQELSKAER